MGYEQRRQTGCERREAERESARDAGTRPAGSMRVLRFPVVRERTGLSRSTVWRLERRGAFPSHRRISLNAVGWLEHEIDAWIAECRR